MEFSQTFREGLDRLFRWRRDVRRFRTDPLPEAQVQRLLAAAESAPSVGLSQPWRWVMVQSPHLRTRVRDNFEAANRDALQSYADDRAKLYTTLKLSGLAQAPVQIAAFCDDTTQKGAGLGVATMPETRRYSVVGAIYHLWLAARAEGVGLGWVSILDPVQLTRDLETPDGWTFIAYLCLGLPEEAHEDPELERAGWEVRASAPALIR